MVTWRKRGFRDSCLEKETIKAAQVNTARRQGQFPAVLWERRAAGPVFCALAWGADAVQESSREPTEPAGTARGACEGTGDRAAPGSHVRSSTLTGVQDPGAALMGYCQVTDRLSFQGQKHRIIKQLQAHVWAQSLSNIFGFIVNFSRETISHLVHARQYIRTNSSKNAVFCNQAHLFFLTWNSIHPVGSKCIN